MKLSPKIPRTQVTEGFIGRAECMPPSYGKEKCATRDRIWLLNVSTFTLKKNQISSPYGCRAMPAEISEATVVAEYNFWK